MTNVTFLTKTCLPGIRLKSMVFDKSMTQQVRGFLPWAQIKLFRRGSESDQERSPERNQSSPEREEKKSRGTQACRRKGWICRECQKQNSPKAVKGTTSQQPIRESVAYIGTKDSQRTRRISSIRKRCAASETQNNSIMSLWPTWRFDARNCVYLSHLQWTWLMWRFSATTWDAV